MTNFVHTGQTKLPNPSCAPISLIEMSRVIRAFFFCDPFLRRERGMNKSSPFLISFVLFFLAVIPYCSSYSIWPQPTSVSLVLVGDVFVVVMLVTVR